MGKRGGPRPGSGRKKGTLNAKTLERQAIAAAYNQRIMTQADALFHAQLTLAVGSVMVYRVDEAEGSNGKTKREHVLVTSPDEIKTVLDGIGDGAGVVGESYYFVSSVLPDNRSLDSLLNRGLGRPKEVLEVQPTDPKTFAAEVEEELIRLGWEKERAQTFVQQKFPEISDAIH